MDKSNETVVKKIIQKYILVVIVFLLVFTYVGYFAWAKNHEVENPATKAETIEPNSNSENPSNSAASNEMPDPSEFKDTNSLLILANKSNPLPDGYIPKDLVEVKGVSFGSENTMLRKPAALAAQEMIEAARKDGVEIVFGSGYRSAEKQRYLWNNYASQYGNDAADRFSSRPSYSEHQTGLCFDAAEGDGSLDGCNYNDGFFDSPQGKWLYKHAHEYGFILRYPQGKEEITGYKYEPWHYRYIGKDWATKMYEISPDLTFEEYFELEGGTSYKD